MEQIAAGAASFLFTAFYNIDLALPMQFLQAL